MFASVVTMLWPGTQLDSSIQFSAIPCYLFIFHDLRVTQVLYKSSGWCCSHSSLPSHGLGPHAFLCSTESHIFLQVSSNSATKCMLGKFIILNCACECEWLVICLFEPFGGLANRSWRLWSFLWTFFIWRIRNFPWTFLQTKPPLLVSGVACSTFMGALVLVSTQLIIAG